MYRLKQQKSAYFDYAATTPVDSLVVDEMSPYWEAGGLFGNPSSIQHSFGTRANEAIDYARKRVAASLGASLREVFWTSGATEANNIAIQGAMRVAQKPISNLITVATEHHAVLDPANYLKAHGAQVEILPVSASGLLDIDRLEDALRISKKALVSIMWVNNETGVLQNIASIANLCKAYGAFLHVDATQAIGRVPINLRKVPIDLLSCSAHKVYGPKGVGALFVRRGVPLEPLYLGGGQEMGIRPGTLPVPLIVGMGKAFDLGIKDMKKSEKTISVWHERVTESTRSCGGAKVNGALGSKIPHILNISFDGIERDLASAFQRTAVSNGSACTSAKTRASHVLMAMGLSKKRALASIRISFGRFTSDKEVNVLIDEIASIITKLRGRRI